MKIRINCVDNDRGPWCKNQNVKKSLFGLGARMCPVFDGGQCGLQRKHPRPKGPPPPPGKDSCQQ